MWNFWQYLHPNSGLTPPYAQTPKTGSDFPFYPPWAKPTGGTDMVPYGGRSPVPIQGAQPPAVYQPGLPAIRPASPLANSSGGGLSSLLNMLRPMAGSTTAKAGLRSMLFGPLATGLSVGAQVMQPTPMGAEPPLYVRGPGGQMTPNTANPLAAHNQIMPGSGNQMIPASYSPNGPQRVISGISSDPQVGDQAIAQKLQSLIRGPVPLPKPRPTIPNAPVNPFYSGPGAQNFGVDGTPSGNTFGQGPGVLDFLFRKQ